MRMKMPFPDERFILASGMIATRRIEDLFYQRIGSPWDHMLPPWRSPISHWAEARPNTWRGRRPTYEEESPSYTGR